jgi:hypothetical protein
MSEFSEKLNEPDKALNALRNIQTLLYEANKRVGRDSGKFLQKTA